MLCEGAYLHLLLKYTWGVKQWQMWCLVTAGWPLLPVSIIPYTYCRTGPSKWGVTELIDKQNERKHIIGQRFCKCPVKYSNSNYNYESMND